MRSELSFAVIAPALVLLLFIIRFIVRKITSPNRTTTAAFFDTLLEIPHTLQLGGFSKKGDIYDAAQQAVKDTKLYDFGCSDEDGQKFLKRYAIVREVSQQEMNLKLSPIGQAIVRKQLITRVTERLKLVDYLKRHPTIKEIKLQPPIFVVGLTRTGTTFLHEKLGLHESVRMHYTWEQMTSIPNTDDESLSAQSADRVKRHAAQKMFFKFVFGYVVSHKLQSIHRIVYDEPEECTLPCSYELPWALSELALHVIACEQLFPLGAGRAYSFYRQWLQLMTWQAADRRGQEESFTWMLKCPFHLPYLDDLFDEFPGAVLVWTHRDPADCIPSACSLFETLLKVTHEEHSVDAKKIGQAVMRYSRLIIDRALQSIEKHSHFKVVHVRYDDNIRNSKAVCAEILQKAGIPLTREYEQRLEAYLAENARQRKEQARKNKANKEVLHEYRPEDYGLTAEGIRLEFADYINRFVK